MNPFIYTWPEANASLADKMTKLVEESEKLIKMAMGKIR